MEQDNKKEQLLQKYEEDVLKLQKQYMENMKALCDIPKRISKEQLAREGELITYRIKEIMDQVGKQFKDKINAMTDEFVEEMSNMGE